jgi:hypothetical protein
MVRNKRNRRRDILADEPGMQGIPVQPKMITFGSPRRSADCCTYLDAPAQFAICLDCSFNGGAHGSGILCNHRFGIDPTLVDGRATQLQGNEIMPLDLQ